MTKHMLIEERGKREDRKLRYLKREKMRTGKNTERESWKMKNIRVQSYSNSLKFNQKYFVPKS